MNLQQTIEIALRDALNPVFLEVVNDSGRHAGHAGDDGSGESHYIITVVSSRFAKMPRLQRHRMIYDILRASLQELPHALAVNAFSESEHVLKLK